MSARIEVFMRVNDGTLYQVGVTRAEYSEECDQKTAELLRAVADAFDGGYVSRVSMAGGPEPEPEG